MALAPRDKAWSILLRELPQYLARPTERQPHESDMGEYCRLWCRTVNPRSDFYFVAEQARDLVALVLAQKPHTPEASIRHSDAKILLLRMALSNAWVEGQRLAYQARNAYMGRHGSRLNPVRVFARPRQRYGNHDQRIFLPIRALGETERDAVRVWNLAAQNRDARRRLR